MLDKTGKYLPGTSTLAYWALLSGTKEKSFITWTPEGCDAGRSDKTPGSFHRWHTRRKSQPHPGPNVIKLFFSVIYKCS